MLLDFKHTVIYGPPGTGKTEIAEIIGTLYSKGGNIEKECIQESNKDRYDCKEYLVRRLMTKNVIEWFRWSIVYR